MIPVTGAVPELLIEYNGCFYFLITAFLVKFAPEALVVPMTIPSEKERETGAFVKQSEEIAFDQLSDAACFSMRRDRIYLQT